MEEIKSHDLKVIGITETWLNEDISDEELALPNFYCLRRDRPKSLGKGGGVLLYIHSSLGVPIECSPPSGNMEQELWIKIKKRNVTFLAGIIYKSTSSSATNSAKILDSLNWAVSTVKPSHLLIMGDFNLPAINWISEPPLLFHDRDEISNEFLKTLDDLFLTQHVRTFTRFRGIEKSTLDLVISNEPEMVDDIAILKPLGKSDHAGVLWSFYFKGDLNPSESRPKLCFRRGNFEKISQDLENANWRLNDNLDVEQLWHNFKNIINTTTDENIPTLSMRDKTHAPWLNRHLRRYLNKKRKAFLKYKASHSMEDYATYKRIRNETCSINKDCRINYEKEIMDNAKTCPKRFYAYVNKNKKVRNKIGCIVTKAKKELLNTNEIADELNDHFADVFVQENDVIPQFDPPNPPNSSLEFFDVTEEMVKCALDALNPNKAAGPDNIYPIILNRFSRLLKKPLCHIFNLSLSTGILPKDWKVANVTPLYKKKGSRKDPDNYRPVSLTSQVCKVLERIINQSLKEHIINNDILPPEQHGFTTGRSCLTNILAATERWHQALDEGHATDVIFLDFAKAFDTVPHKRLLHKLNRYGINGRMLKWLESFLTGREQRVVLDGTPSAWTSVASGVPQGTVLGPTLFLLYVADIPHVVKSFLEMFADDTKIYRCIKNLDDRRVLQGDLDALEKWSDDWLLKFKFCKCKHMTIARRQALPEFRYQMHDNGVPTDVDVCTEEKDLGVIICNTLKVKKQCIAAANKANRALGMIKRAFHTPSAESFVKIYKAFVRPHLEYAIQAWNPQQEGDIQILERVQRRALKCIRGFNSLSYIERLQRTGVFPLVSRRERGDLIETFKIIKGIDKAAHVTSTLASQK